jgi:outer membrane protein OmpA-like peptidoglycan-associated protein
MTRGLVALIAVLVFLLFAYLCVNHHAPHIQADVLSRTNATLSAAHVAGIRATADGRDMVLTGTVAGEQIRDQALADVRSTYGVRRVTDQLQIGATHQLNATLADNQLCLNGRVPSAAMRDAVLQAASSKNCANNRVQVDASESTWMWPAAVTAQFAQLLSGNFMADTATLQLKGVAPNAQTRDQVLRTIQNSLTSEVKTQLDITVATQAPPAPASAEITAQANTCQQDFNELLAGEQIRFDSGSAVLSAQSQKLLSRLAEVANRCPAANIRIEGHTDNIGNAALNKSLSEQRAQAVADRLAQLDVAAARLSHAGFGADKPLADNRSSKGRAQNRRIEFHVEGALP